MTEEPSGLEFERAQFEGGLAAARCALCGGDLSGTYYEVNGAVACGACRARREAEFGGGVRPGRFVKAAGLGILAALGGSALYYGVRALTGYEFGLIAVVVGFLVGGAVRFGSRGRGGWLYQGLAMVLTYLSIVSTFIPDIALVLEPKIAEADLGAARAVILPVTVLVVACAAPFLMGLSNLMGIIIIGIGLYEAWKINKRVPLVVHGPFQVISSVPAPAPSAPVG